MGTGATDGVAVAVNVGGMDVSDAANVGGGIGFGEASGCIPPRRGRLQPVDNTINIHIVVGRRRRNLGIG